MAKVYISSTYRDLIKEREAAAWAVRQLSDLDPVAMEDYTASDDRPLDKCLGDVRSVDIYVGIFGWRYGFIPDGYDKSITQLEYEAAHDNKKCLIFLRENQEGVAPDAIDTGPAAERMTALREMLQDRHVCAFYKNVEDLRAKVSVALGNLFRRDEQPPIPAILPYLSDRSVQKHQLAEALACCEDRGDHPPLVGIVHGHEFEAHDMFVERLHEVTLPGLLRMPRERSSIKDYFRAWPEPSGDVKARASRMRASLAESISGSMSYKADETASAINRHETPVLVHSHLHACDWQQEEPELIREWLGMWNSLASNITACQTFVVLAIKYADTQGKGFLKRRSLAKTNDRIKSFLKDCDVTGYSNLYVVKLDPLQAISQGDVETWVHEYASEFCHKEELIPKIREIFSEAGQLSMEKLAPELKALLLKHRT
jgi:hypothetical protein